METDRNVAEVLRAIGMSPKYKGYCYLLFMLGYAHMNPEHVYSSSSALYPAAMEHFGLSRKNLERNIRFAIERAWENPVNPGMQELFRTYDITYVPTIREFISIVTECICFRRFPDPIQLRFW
jgi:two-component system response regulator (stage 0 sporulation protein A)